ncbi:S-type pyocin domain-containing protein [Streptomyces sp. NPDC089915]|uniref:S-type pyocin domain-containing protein n=1 Tax=Streptomyces sp. NPDC089915 TaxID=3155186 RepID=UPI00343220F0
MRENQVHPAGSQAVPDDAREPAVSPRTVLKADRGIINTGTVHGGQHLTVTESLQHPVQGAEGDV